MCDRRMCRRPCLKCYARSLRRDTRQKALDFRIRFFLCFRCKILYGRRTARRKLAGRGGPDLCPRGRLWGSAAPRAPDLCPKESAASRVSQALGAPGPGAPAGECGAHRPGPLPQGQVRGECGGQNFPGAGDLGFWVAPGGAGRPKTPFPPPANRWRPRRKPSTSFCDFSGRFAGGPP